MNFGYSQHRVSIDIDTLSRKTSQFGVLEVFCHAPFSVILNPRRSAARRALHHVCLVNDNQKQPA